MPCYRLLVEYEGTKFSGWQVQPRQRTVQGVLLDALRATLGEDKLNLQGAGRTDAGVHALAQNASLHCSRQLNVGQVLRHLERALPADVAVLDLRLVHDRFHARHDADARAYRYQITGRRSAFGKRLTWWVPQCLDQAAMAAAAAGFVGRHDFRAFARKSRKDRSTVVVVESLEVASQGDFVLIRCVASHFLWGQMRRMVGALVSVGKGEASPADIARWLDGSLPAPELAAPASGLFLEAVRYPGTSWRLPPLTPLGVPCRPDVEKQLSRTVGSQRARSTDSAPGVSNGSSPG